MATFGAEPTWRGIRLSSLCEVTWARCCVSQSGVCGSFYKGNSCSHYSNSYVIIWCGRHLRTTHATKTFILFICQYICASHFSLSPPPPISFLLLFINGRTHPNSQTIGFSPEIVLRQLLSHSTSLNAFICIYITCMLLNRKLAFWHAGPVSKHIMTFN